MRIFSCNFASILDKTLILMRFIGNIIKLLLYYITIDRSTIYFGEIMKKSETKTLLIKTGIKIIIRKGFNSTGIQEILKTADVPKGSFYFYFDSKDDFGLEIIDHYAQYYIREIDIKLQNKCFPPITRLRNFFSAFSKKFEEDNFSGGNLLGNLMQEMGDINETFRKKLRTIYSIIINKFIGCLKEAQLKGSLSESLDVKETVEFIISAWEGALMRAKIDKSIKPIKQFDTFIFTLIGKH